MSIKMLQPIALVMLIVSAACSHKRQLRRTDSAEAFYAANRSVRNRTVEVFTNGNTTFALRSISIFQDYITGFELDGNAHRSIAAGDLLEVRYNSASRGAVDGALFGIVSGAALVFALYSEPESCGGIGAILPCSRAETAFLVWCPQRSSMRHYWRLHRCPHKLPFRKVDVGQGCEPCMAATQSHANKRADGEVPHEDLHGRHGT